MDVIRDVGRPARPRGKHEGLLAATIGALLCGLAGFPVFAADAADAAPVKIAVFDFELEDARPAALLPGAAAPDPNRLKAVSERARQVLAQSGRYSLVDVSKVDAKPVVEKSLRHCEGCETAIALQLGAEQSMVGVLRAISMTDYYVLIQISDCRSGKVLNQQLANFSGGEDGWASGVASLIRHRVLASDY